MSGKELPNLSSALVAAKSLLGWKLVHKSSRGLTSGFIVETEAYTMEDPASHAYGGMRKRNASMYEAAGTIYVYFTYGMHFCMNIVTGQKGHGQGVLIRALEPTEGVDLMRSRRMVASDVLLTNGPAKLTQAMGVDLSDNGAKLQSEKFWLEPGIKPEAIVQTTRVGISKAIDKKWRFFIADNRYVSKR